MLTISGLISSSEPFMKKALLKTIVFAMALCAPALSPAHAEIRILASSGGEVGPLTTTLPPVGTGALTALTCCT